MSKTITISGTPIDFPESGESPDWAPAVLEFAEATADALSGVVGAFDVSPQIMNIDAYNPTSINVDVTNLSFSVTSVRSATITMAVSRERTDGTKKTELSLINIVYNASNSIGSKWELTREITGNAYISFNITDNGQVQFTNTAIGSSGTHTGILSYSAKAQLNS